MKVILQKQNRIDGNAGDIVEVSPDRAAFLFTYGLAEPAETREQKEAPEKRMRAETPEAETRTEKPETPVKKTTRKAKK